MAGSDTRSSQQGFADRGSTVARDLDVVAVPWITVTAPVTGVLSMQVCRAAVDAVGGPVTDPSGNKHRIRLVIPHPRRGQRRSFQLPAAGK